MKRTTPLLILLLLAALSALRGNPLILLAGPGGYGPSLPQGINQVTFTASQALTGFGSSITLVECTSGSSVQLQVYDNAYGATGSVVYSVTLSSGQTALPSFVTINGIYAVVTGTGTFRVTINSNL